MKFEPCLLVLVTLKNYFSPLEAMFCTDSVPASLREKSADQNAYLSAMKWTNLSSFALAQLKETLS